MKNKALLPFLVGAINFFIFSASDIFTPALPEIANFFNVTESEASYTISFYLVFMAISTLIFGPLSDQIGKKRVAIILSIFLIIGSIVSLSANSFTQLVIGRSIQGIGAAMIAVNIALMRDHIKANEFSSSMSKISMIIALAPAIAPIIGGLIISRYPWKMNFVAILISCITTLILTTTLFPKDKKVQRSNIAQKVRNIFHDYKLLFSNKNYLMLVFIVPLNYGIFWADLANLPFIIVSYMHFDPIYYSYAMATGVAFYLVGHTLNQILVKRTSLSVMLKRGIILLIVFNLIVLAIRCFTTINPIIYSLLRGPLTIGMAFIHANSSSLALGATQHKSGSAVSLLSFCQLAFSSVIVWISTIFFNGTVFPLLIIAFVNSILILLLYKLSARTTD